MFIDGVESLMFAHVVIHLFAAPRRVVREDSPVIIVLCRTADVHHEVDTTAASKNLAAWNVICFAVRLRHSLEVPVVFLITQKLCEHTRRVDQEIV